MTGARQIAVTALLLWLAAIGQGGLAYSVRIGPAQPDFPLIVLACGAALLGETPGTGLGVWCGLLTATLSLPFNFGSYLTSRMMAGWLAGVLQRHVVRDNLLVPPLVVLAATLVAEAVYALMAPPHQARLWLLAVGGEMLYNTLLALPVFLLLRRLQIGKLSDDSFGTLA